MYVCVKNEVSFENCFTIVIVTIVYIKLSRTIEF